MPAFVAGFQMHSVLSRAPVRPVGLRKLLIKLYAYPPDIFRTLKVVYVALLAFLST